MADSRFNHNKQRKLYQNSIKQDAKLSDVLKYKNYHNVLTKLKRISKINFYKYKCEEYKNNTKELWGLINSCIGKHKDKRTVIENW